MEIDRVGKGKPSGTVKIEGAEHYVMMSLRFMYLPILQPFRCTTVYFKSKIMNLVATAQPVKMPAVQM